MYNNYKDIITEVEKRIKENKKEKSRAFYFSVPADVIATVPEKMREIEYDYKPAFTFDYGLLKNHSIILIPN